MDLAHRVRNGYYRGYIMVSVGYEMENLDTKWQRYEMVKVRNDFPRDDIFTKPTSSSIFNLRTKHLNYNFFF